MRAARCLGRVLGPIVVAALAASLGCQDETLGVLVPHLSICPAEDAGAGDCDRDVDIGDVFVGAPLPLTLFLKNAGEGSLGVAGASVDNDVVVLGDVASRVRAGLPQPLPLTLTLPEDALGAGRATLTVRSDDPDAPTRSVVLLWNGVPPPAPDVVVCVLDDGVEADCGTALAVDVGLVRRSQRQGVALRVKNAGTADLAIEDVALDDGASVEGEVVIASSTRPATLAAGEDAPLVVVYAPKDAGEDVVTLTLQSDDPDTPAVTVTLRGHADDNLAPVARAVATLGAAAAVEGTVDDVVQVDATASSDPEGDPLVYRWSLAVPAGSAAALDDAAAARAEFVPDVAGSYEAAVVVTDSLGQQSAAAVVTVDVRPRFGLRAQLSWVGDADVDLHIVDAGGALFDDNDCSFAHREVGDCALVDDAAAGPGPEEAVFVTPTGSFEIWAQVFAVNDDSAAFDTTLRLVIDDAASPVLTQTATLPAAPCATWHIADVSYPGPTLRVLEPALGSQCP